MQPLLDWYSILKEEFAGDSAILIDIDRELERGKEWISEQMEDDSQKDRPSRIIGDVDTSDHAPLQVRGIFHDVDD
jgi:hypothetical protein